jgi:pimeloyl-ACP methyl ester carboxylesterase
MKRAFTDIPEGQIHYRTEGEGEPILLLHMAVASSDEFTRVMHFLSGKYRVIALDCLGFGDSDPAPREYQIIDHARSVISFMDALHIKKTNVVGQFFGAEIAVELAVNWPKRINKLVLAGAEFWEDSQAVDLKEPTNFTTTVEIKQDGSHLLEWWRRACLWGDYSLEILEERVIEYIKAGPRGEEAHWAGGNYNSKHRLPLITCPTLVLDATGFPLHSRSPVVQRLIPNSTLTTIENGPMYCDRAMPKEYAGAILDFMNSTDY